MNANHSQDGQVFIKSLAQFIRQHEKALANSLQLSLQRRHTAPDAGPAVSPVSPTIPSLTQSQTPGSLMSVFAHAGLRFSTQAVRSAHLTLTPHHLFYLLSQIEELGIGVGPMNVRVESLHNDLTRTNYVSFLQGPKIPTPGRSDADSIHSVSSIRSVASLMSGFWSNLGLGSSNAKSEKAKAVIQADLKYLYSAFTKLPSLRLTADHRAQLISGYEEFPFDTAVPLFVFKNVQQLDIVDMDFRQFHGWDRMAEQLTLLTVKRANVEDIEDLLTNIVLDDAEKRRRRSNRRALDGPSTPSWTVPSTPPTPHPFLDRTNVETGSPPSELSSSIDGSCKEQQGPYTDLMDRTLPVTSTIVGSSSPRRPTPSRPVSSYRHARSYSSKIKRSGSGSSNCSDCGTTPQRRESISILANVNSLPASKWQRLKYLSLADNALTSISAHSITPLTNTLRSLNLSSNLFNEIPDSLTALTRLTSLDLSNCLIDSLQSLLRCPLPAITTLKLKTNRIHSLAGVERLVSLENLHVQDNHLSDPMEAARLTGMPNMRRIWIKHNPLVKQYSNYRITIFNLFRQTPGYVDDLLIDDHPPSYAERKALIPRVPEQEIPRSLASDRIWEIPVIIQHARTDESQVDRPPQVEALQESNSTSSRRKKGPRRRIVDLAARDEQHPLNSTAGRVKLAIDTQKSDGITVADQAADASEHPALAKFESNYSADSVDGISQDEYRARIEALRQQFGNNWLSALSSGQSTQTHHNSTHDTLTQQLPIHHSVMMVSAGRSLG